MQDGPTVQNSMTLADHRRSIVREFDCRDDHVAAVAEGD
jgi:hypothetical protein